MFQGIQKGCMSIETFENTPTSFIVYCYLSNKEISSFMACTPNHILKSITSPKITAQNLMDYEKHIGPTE